MYVLCQKNIYNIFHHLLIRNGEFNSCKFHSCLSVRSSLTAATAATAGNINEKHTTSFTPDDILQETPTHFVEKRFHE